MRSSVKILLFVLLVICTTQNVYSRDILGKGTKPVIGFSAGIGFSDLMNLKIRIPAGQFQVTAGVGFMPIKDESVYSVMGDVYYHFAGHSSYTDVRPWFIRSGLNYLNDKADSWSTKDLFLGVRIGREMNITEHFGIDVDAGAGFKLWHEATGNVIDLKFTVWPLINLSFFFLF